MKFLLILLILSTAGFSQENTEAGQDTAENIKIRYRSPKAMDFDDALIQGKLDKPEISIITANEKDELADLLKLRSDFKDAFDRQFQGVNKP